MKAEDEKSKKLEEFWNKFGPVYTSITEEYNSPLALQLALQTKVHTAKTVIEAACGSGIGSFVVRSFLKPGSVYCCSDLSGGMLDMFKKRYENSDFIKNPANRFVLNVEESKDKIVPKAISESGVTLSLHKGNNESLPFESNSFDSYIASASLYVVDSPQNMLKEAHRVLKPGGIAGFAVFGKLKDSSYFTVAVDLLNQYAAKHKVELPKRRSLFHLGGNDEELKAMVKAAGFTNVKLWHQYTVYNLTAEEYAREKVSVSEEIFSLFPPGTLKEYKEDLEKEVQKKIIDQEGGLINIDFIIIVCSK